jgi:hypothetical protein
MEANSGGIAMIRSCLTGLRLIVGLSPMLATATALGQAGQDEEEAFDRTPQECVIVSRIDQTEAIDDQNILFHMRGDQVFRNTLPRKCPGLERENRIAYQTVSARLCNIDTITVLEDFGVGLRPGFTCRLGQFVPLSPEEVEELEFLEEEGQGGRRAVETSSVEADGDAEPAQAGDSEAAADDGSADEPADDEG